ncbi:TPA: transcriptional regulator [Pseudomonas aeruginosa]|nr:transcriptional regulator [Pseudomonas aeruginosa]
MRRHTALIDAITEITDNQGRTNKHELGAGKSTYIGWEHDINPPPADKLIPLAKELDVSIDTILFGENAGMSAEMRDLFRRFDELSPAVKPQAKLLLRALLFSLESGAAQGEEHAA